jgi:ribosomal protein S18 acetylase RimI-like enzyme
VSERPAAVIVRPTQRDDFDEIHRLCLAVYPNAPPWSERQLASHLGVFPEGQLVAVEPGSGRLVGMAASLMVLWDDYEIDTNWRDMTDHGMFTNHDPAGHTLYGAEVMVDPERQRRGIGKALYRARRDLAARLELRRIRAGARLRGYHRYADRLDPEEYVREVVAGRIADPTLSFQLRQRFRVLAVVSDYLRHDPDSLGHAAVIEWINYHAARRRDWADRPAKFTRRAVRDSSG